MSIPAATRHAPKRHPQIPEPGVAVALLGEAAEHRAELMAIELQEAREHALVSTALAVAAGVLGLLAGFALTFLVAGLVWENPHRGWWLAGLCVCYLAAALAAGGLLARRLRGWRPLGETQQQLRKDYQCLRILLKSVIP